MKRNGKAGLPMLQQVVETFVRIRSSTEAAFILARLPWGAST